MDTPFYRGLPSSIIIDCTVTARYSLSSIIYEKNDVTAF